MHSISISADVKMQGNQRTKRTKVRGSQSVKHHKISPNCQQIHCASLQQSTMLQQLYISAKCHAGIRTDFTRLKIISEYSFSKLLVVKIVSEKMSKYVKIHKSKARNQRTKVCSSYAVNIPKGQSTTISDILGTFGTRIVMLH